MCASVRGGCAQREHVSSGRTGSGLITQQLSNCRRVSAPASTAACPGLSNCCRSRAPPSPDTILDQQVDSTERALADCPCRSRAARGADPCSPCHGGTVCAASRPASHAPSRGRSCTRFQGASLSALEASASLLFRTRRLSPPRSMDRGQHDLGVKSKCFCALVPSTHRICLQVVEVIVALKVNSMRARGSLRVVVDASRPCCRPLDHRDALARLGDADEGTACI